MPESAGDEAAVPRPHGVSAGFSLDSDAPPLNSSPAPLPPPTPLMWAPPPAPGARQLYTDELRTGQCLLVGTLGETVLEVPVVPCTQRHDAEVVGVRQMPGSWQGLDALDALSDQLCSRIFRRYVGEDADSSDYDMGWFSPSEETWQDGDRRLVCYAESDTATLTGSVKGTG